MVQPPPSNRTVLGWRLGAGASWEVQPRDLVSSPSAPRYANKAPP